MFEPLDRNPTRRSTSADPSWHIEVLERIAREALAAYAQTCQPSVRVRRTKGRVRRGANGEIQLLPEREVTEVVPAKPDRRFLAIARRALADAEPLRALVDARQPRNPRASAEAGPGSTDLDLPLDRVLLPRYDGPAGE